MICLITSVISFVIAYWIGKGMAIREMKDPFRRNVQIEIEKQIKDLLEKK